MITKIIRQARWYIAAILLWLAYVFISIVTFPTGKVSDTAEVAIILGAAVYQTKPSPVFAERINHAITLYQQGSVKKLVFTGAAAGGISDKHKQAQTTLAESVVAQNYAINKQVSPDDIHIETRSETTRENLIYSNEILVKHGFKTALIVSDPLHLKRAMLMTKDLAINAKPSATPTTRYRSFKKKLPFALRELYFYHHYLLFSR